MRFAVEQAIPAPRDAVEAAFCDPAFYRTLSQLGPIGVPEVLERRAEHGGAVVHLEVRYRFTGRLPAGARRVLDPSKLTWVDVSRFDRSAHCVEFRFVPDHYPDRLSCSGTYRFDEAPGGTIQRMAGELVVRAPVVGPLVERALVSGLRQYLGEEARLLARFVGEGGGERGGEGGGERGGEGGGERGGEGGRGEGTGAR
jgi:uncharacterized membrane protein YgcG